MKKCHEEIINKIQDNHSGFFMESIVCGKALVAGERVGDEGVSLF